MGTRVSENQGRKRGRSGTLRVTGRVNRPRVTRTVDALVGPRDCQSHGTSVSHSSLYAMCEFG
jgi:hypothetical protein